MLNHLLELELRHQFCSGRCACPETSRMAHSWSYTLQSPGPLAYLETFYEDDFTAE